MVASVNDNDELQLNAYCDGELDLASAAAFERRLADDELLRAQYTRLMSLRQAFGSLPQSDVPRGCAPVSSRRSMRSVRAGLTFCVNEAGRCGPWLRRRVWRRDLKLRHDDDRALSSTRGGSQSRR